VIQRFLRANPLSILALAAALGCSRGPQRLSPEPETAPVASPTRTIRARGVVIASVASDAKHGLTSWMVPCARLDIEGEASGAAPLGCESTSSPARSQRDLQDAAERLKTSIQIRWSPDGELLAARTGGGGAWLMMRMRPGHAGLSPHVYLPGDDPPYLALMRCLLARIDECAPAEMIESAAAEVPEIQGCVALDVPAPMEVVTALVTLKPGAKLGSREIAKKLSAILDWSDPPIVLIRSRLPSKSSAEELYRAAASAAPDVIRELSDAGPP
jgi:hypothetical protein